MASVYGQNAAMFKVPADPRRIFIPEQLRSGEKSRVARAADALPALTPG